MSTLIRRISVVALIALFATVINTYSQPANKVRERISMMKKMKLIEILNLDEQAADKFIAQYSSWEKKIDAQRQAVDKASEELRSSLKKDASNDEITKMTDALIGAQNKLYDMNQEKLKALKSQLSIKDYGKLVVFEDRFFKELQKILFKRAGKHGPGGGPHSDDE